MVAVLETIVAQYVFDDVRTFNWKRAAIPGCKYVPRIAIGGIVQAWNFAVIPRAKLEPAISIFKPGAEFGRANDVGEHVIERYKILLFMYLLATHTPL